MNCEPIYGTWHLDRTNETEKSVKTELLPQKTRLKYKTYFSWNNNNKQVEMVTKVKATANRYDLNFLTQLNAVQKIWTASRQNTCLTIWWTLV